MAEPGFKESAVSSKTRLSEGHCEAVHVLGATVCVWRMPFYVSPSYVTMLSCSKRWRFLAWILVLLQEVTALTVADDVVKRYRRCEQSGSQRRCWHTSIKAAHEQRHLTPLYLWNEKSMEQSCCPEKLYVIYPPWEKPTYCNHQASIECEKKRQFSLTQRTGCVV